MKTHSAFLICALVLSTGCATRHAANQNAAAAKRLALLFKINENGSSDPAYPESLEHFEKLLRTQGIEDPLPKCKCADGKLRDFVYIRGFRTGDDTGMAFLFSPPEMDPDVSVVAYLDSTVKIMQRSDAAVEEQKSRTFTNSRLRVPDKAAN